MVSTTLNNRGMEEKQGPSFFKIIITGFNTEDLRIPPKFQKQILNELSDKATLNLEDGSDSSWTVEVSQTEGEIYFKNGWKKFIRDNSLGDFEFLVFRYERNMQFSIEIFDGTACKRIKFPNVIKTDKPGTHTQSHQSNKLKEVKEEEEDYQDDKEEAAALPKAKGPSFTRIIGKTLYNEAIPVEFAEQYMSWGYYTILMKNSEGRAWEVSIVPNGLGQEGTSRTIKLSAGWANFRRENQIKPGDTCTFELVKSKTMVVHIYHK